MICISVSLGFRQKPNDTALLLIIALTMFKCIVGTLATKGALICFVVTVHWWHHRTHYDITETYRVLRNVLTVHLNNGATRTNLKGVPKHCKVTAKAGRQSTIYTGDFDEIFCITRYGINPYSYSGFLWATWRETSARLAGNVIQVWINSLPSNQCISLLKAQLAQLFSIQNLIFHTG